MGIHRPKEDFCTMYYVPLCYIIHQFGKVCCIYNFRYFQQKGKLFLKSLLSEGRYFLAGSLLLAFANTCESFSLLSEECFVQEKGRGVVTFGTYLYKKFILFSRSFRLNK